MTVARWEFWSVAMMLIATHSDEAEYEAADKLEDAQARKHSGDILVWNEILIKIAEIRAEKAK